ncbi:MULTISPECIES: YfaP family protein [Shewanella]|uniref:Dystroglycan-type cadherin-like domain-containing protein n=1 Tax=Shewanella psychromarinicola TaxID=2487742 RepID=A0A3N4E844_9GAMM|nr:putative Ig domain-containing protein [Shewanella psychromarinicola]AZG36537.1 hypothetical protein EGC80_17850 [Shewanella psychromarinicola]MCL1083104.1 putative Ig domain-containing protein [Shewanella psychromarinicola]RPA34385.1 hypothetical protein EGC77_01485 [Shewanella psychromarinicola]
MELTNKWQLSIVAIALSFVLTGCDSSSEDEVIQNIAPLISASAVVTAIEDSEYLYQLTVTDPDDANDGTNLTFTLTNPPDGMTINNTGLISWTPLEGVLTSGTVSVTVRDGGEDEAQQAVQDFDVIVTPVNDAPFVSAIAAQSIDSGSTFTYQLLVSDVDDTDTENDISFELVAGPTGLSISPSGLMSYTSSVLETISTDISVQVTDGGEDGVAPVQVSFNLNEKYFYTISGTTINYFNGEVIPDSVVSLSNGNLVVNTTTSDAEGLFTSKIQDIQLSDRLTLVADASDYSEAALSISRNELTQEHNLLLQPVHASISFDATQVSELAVDGNVLVTLPENSLVDLNGNLVSSAVVAELTVINPAIDIEMMPGDMLTTNSANEIVPIESFGAITVSFVDSAGNKLQLAPNKVAQIKIPVAGTNPPATIPLYYFDTTSGLWIEEGEALLFSVNDESFYQGNVSHFTTWNADMIYDTIIVNGCVEDEDGNLLNGARVISDGRDYLGRSLTFSIDDGTFSIPVKSHSTVLLGATIEFQSRTSIINTFEEDITLAECLVLSEALTKITLNWGEAPRDLDSHLYITDAEGNESHVYYANSEVTINETIIYLDVDDITSYGPEVISIPQFPVEGSYDYYVKNFSDSPDINPATTRVEFIFNNEQHIFSPPTDGITKWWHVAKIEKDADGQLLFAAINEWSEEPQSVTVQSSQRQQSVVPIKKIESIVKGMINSKYYDNHTK